MKMAVICILAGFVLGLVGWICLVSEGVVA
jgi:hypothetical protein